MNNEFFINLQNKIEGKGIDELQCIFYETARDLMNNYLLKIDKLEIELTEIEFYYFDEKYHKDPYVHKDELQQKTGHLYVHKKVGNYGGIDLTFGNGNYFGGILIRGIKVKNRDKNTFISGSAKIRWTIIENFGIDDEYEIIQDFFKNLKNQNKISLENRDTSKEKYDVLHSIRINLGKKIDNDEFRNALYRFARLDYIDAKPDNFPEKKKSVKDITNLKTISNLTGIWNKFSDESYIKKNIEKFKECQKDLERDGTD